MVTVNELREMGVVMEGDDYTHGQLRAECGMVGTEGGSDVHLLLMCRENGELASCELQVAAHELDHVGGDIEVALPTPQSTEEFRGLCRALGVKLPR